MKKYKKGNIEIVSKVESTNAITHVESGGRTLISNMINISPANTEQHEIKNRRTADRPTILFFTSFIVSSQQLIKLRTKIFSDSVRKITSPELSIVEAGTSR
jgi:hypothetical protein